MRQKTREHPYRTGRIFAAVVSTALVLAAVSGCSSSGPSDSGHSGASASGTSGVRTITDATSRTVEVPAIPQRVLALSEPTLDGALALGVPVIGTTSGRGQSGISSYLAAKAKGIPVVASVSGPNLEQVANLKPDLILVDGTVTADEATIGKLSGIAPTVYVSKTGEDWKSAFAAEADAVGKHDAGQQVLADYDAKVSKVKADLGANATATVSIVRWGSSMPSVMLKEIAASTVVSDLGLRRPPSQDKVGKGHSTPVSLENLDQLDADWMFFGTLGGSTNPSGGNSGTSAGVADSRALLATAEKTPGFTHLHAYQSGHVVPVDGSAWMSAGGPLAEDVVLTSIDSALGTS